MYPVDVRSVVNTVDVCSDVAVVVAGFTFIVVVSRFVVGGSDIGVVVVVSECIVVKAVVVTASVGFDVVILALCSTVDAKTAKIKIIAQL